MDNCTDAVLTLYRQQQYLTRAADEHWDGVGE